MSTDPLDVLRNVFGHAGFRGRQEEVVHRVVSGGDAIALFPTGAGKSICYQVPGLCRPGTGVVISPLIALMNDQILALRSKGVRAETINSTLSAGAIDSILSDAAAGKVDFLYVTPERMMRKDFLLKLDKIPLSVIAIDEAHCASQWGHDFRPDYADLGKLAKRFPGVPRIAVTATADPVTKADMMRLLAMEDAPVYATGFDRPNISYAIKRKNDPKKQLLDFVTAREGRSGIVYCLSRKKTEDVVALLEARGIRAAGYHAGMEPADREESQRRFMADEVDVLVGTTAFGMGVDKPDIRYVVHFDWPASIEGYFQETGRAGRDGEPAEALMLYGLDDLARRRMMIQKNKSVVARRVEHDKLSALLGVVESPGCRRRALLSHFGQSMATDCGNCDNCRDPKASKDGGPAVMSLLEHAEAGGLTIHELAERAVSSNEGVTKPEMHSAIRQLVAQGLLHVDHSRLSTVELTIAGKRAMDSGTVEVAAEGIVTLSAAPRPPAPRKPRSAPSGPRPQRPNLEPDQELYLALRRLRNKIARKARMQPFKVFPDATLNEIAAQRPTNRVEFIGIPGVGPTKLDRYGEDFMAVVKDHAIAIEFDEDLSMFDALVEDMDDSTEATR